MKSHDLQQLRGMSEPFAFQFNALDKGRTLLVHAVIFTSYEVDRNSEGTLKLAAPEDDLRMKEFINYCIKNYAKEQKEKLKKRTAELDKAIDDRKRQINNLDHEMQKLEREVKNVK